MTRALATASLAVALLATPAVASAHERPKPGPVLTCHAIVLVGGVPTLVCPTPKRKHEHRHGDGLHRGHRHGGLR